MGPAPSTSARSPGATRAFLAACTATASGSTIAPSAALTVSGSRWHRTAGCLTSGVKQPWSGGVAQNVSEGSRL